MFWSFWGIIQIFQNCDYSWFCLTIVMETSGKVKKNIDVPLQKDVCLRSQQLDLSPRPWLVHLVPLLKAHWTTHNRSSRWHRPIRRCWWGSLTLLLTKSGIKHLRGLGDIDLGLLKLLALLITPPPWWRSTPPWRRSTPPWPTLWRWLTITGHCWGGWKLKILRP